MSRLGELAARAVRGVDDLGAWTALWFDDWLANWTL